VHGVGEILRNYSDQAVSPARPVARRPRTMNCATFVTGQPRILTSLMVSICGPSWALAVAEQGDLRTPRILNHSEEKDVTIGTGTIQKRRQL
jgi:hypothetical protein